LNYIDTHSHLFLDEFKDDIDKVIERAVSKGLKYIVLPNIDSSTIDALISTCKKHPAICFPTIGLHPTSVNSSFEKEIDIVEQYLRNYNSDKTNKYFLAIGETGIDLYWDKDYFEQQKKAFIRQLQLSVDYNLPIIIHSRNSLNEIIEIIQHSTFDIQHFKGIFHCFPGNTEQAKKVIDFGFKIGIGGVVTFKNSGMQEVVKNIDLKEIVLETDSPYLSPDPHRGKRNESSYIPIVAEKIAQIKQISVETVALTTTRTATELFDF
jgi:TatD DNase family protein